MSGVSRMQEYIEPNVIDLKMIETALEGDFPPGELGRLTSEEGVPFEEVKELNLEFLDILRLDCLWMLTSLRILKLACNRIEKIESLDSLTTLVELDLSFNQIEVIENISTLVNLEVFAIYQNRISVLENIETLQKLIILNLGENRITDLQCIIYLRQFPELRSLNMAGNPCTKMKEEGGFRQYVCAFLPDLTYYEYRTILKAERTAAIEVYRYDLAKLKDDESEVNAKKAAAMKRAKEIEFQKTAYIEELDGDYFFDAMFKHDSEGRALLKIEESKEPYEKFHDAVVVCLQEIFALGLKHYDLRQEEMKQYKDCVSKAQEENRLESTRIMGDFIEKKSEIFFKVRTILKNIDELNVSEAEEEACMIKFKADMKELTHQFNALSQDTWYQLMNRELILFEQMEDVNGNFERNMNELVGVFVEGAQSYFAQIRSLQQDYSEAITDVANGFLSLAAVDKVTVPPELTKIMTDKDTLNTATQTSHDVHMRAIDNREDQLVSRIHSWCDNMCKNIIRDEIKRNRNKITEVNNFLDLQKEDFDEVQTLQLEESVEELPVDVEGEGEYEGEYEGEEEFVQELSEEKGEDEEEEEEEDEGEVDSDDLDTFGDILDDEEAGEGVEGEGQEEDAQKMEAPAEETK